MPNCIQYRVLWKVGSVDLYKFQLKADIRDRREAITRLYWRTPTLLLRITSKATENIHPKFFCKSPKSFFLLLQITSKPTEKHPLANLSWIQGSFSSPTFPKNKQHFLFSRAAPSNLLCLQPPKSLWKCRQRSKSLLPRQATRHQNVARHWRQICVARANLIHEATTQASKCCPTLKANLCCPSKSYPHGKQPSQASKCWPALKAKYQKVFFLQILVAKTRDDKTNH